MPECGEGQTPNNERAAKTVLNCFLPDGQASDARVASRKRMKRLLTYLN